MAEAKWLPFEGLVRIVLARYKISVGYAESIVRKALASGEVREQKPLLPDPVLLVYDDGALDMNLRPGAIKKGRVSPDGKLLVQPVRPAGDYSVADFQDWLNRNPPLQAKPTTEQPETVAKSRKQSKRKRAEEAVKELWHDEVPDAYTLLNKHLCARVIEWLRADCRKRKIPWLNISDKTILRAAGRK
jgi:hypothetical protein